MSLSTSSITSDVVQNVALFTQGRVVGTNREMSPPVESYVEGSFRGRLGARESLKPRRVSRAELVQTEPCLQPGADCRIGRLLIGTPTPSPSGISVEPLNQLPLIWRRR